MSTASDVDDTPASDSFEIAIVGMSAALPKAPNIAAFWQLLRDGQEGITFFSDAELTARGVPTDHLTSPTFVKAAPVLADSDKFDAAFFGYTPREAELLDPQHRHFLEHSWHALEHAGYDPDRFDGLIGVYAGTSLSTYLLFNLLTNPRLADHENSFEVMIGNDKDFIATRVSYHLNLRGPSLDVQTGCSTSLVATHLACEALLNYQCDMALAGGVSINVPQRTGYFYQEGGITSPDGHCRAFDEAGGGTLFGSGVGVVVLKRLTDALADRDTIYAVIKSTAINNDGAVKVNYTAPSIDGQTEVISRALTLAQVTPDDITYVETHGTATALGDPIEMAALTDAFRAGTDATQFCAIGTVKSNIGHLDAAAGVAGLIKTTLQLHHREIVPSLHYNRPNPKIDFAASPFFVNAALRPWDAAAGPRRAGVSSFGIGGTNAHAILEEAPTPLPTEGAERPYQLLSLSARSDNALAEATTALAEALQQNPSLSLSDVAYTLHIGRKRFESRRTLVAATTAEAVEKLRTVPVQEVVTTRNSATARPPVFMFPGGGAQYPMMGQALYDEEPTFRAAVDDCAIRLRPLLGYDVRQRLYPTDTQTVDHERFNDTSLALPLLFSVEYALAQLLSSWGITPAAMIGHSMGEYVAACLAGVLSLEDALAVVVKRGQLFEQLPAGAMLSIAAAAGTLQPLLNDQLSIAAVNAPDQCVIAGSVSAIAAFEAVLAAQSLDYRRLQINVAAHSTLVELIVTPFVQFMATLRLNPPHIPFVSNLSGTWITDAEATDPHYWGQHLRHTVRFGEGIAHLLQEPDYLFLEVGPGRTLTTLAKLQAKRTRVSEIVATMRHPYDRLHDQAFLLTTLGKLWATGLEVTWDTFYQDEQRQRVPLPLYPFERQRYWIEPGTPTATHRAPGKLPRLDEWFYTPTWRRTPPRPPAIAAAPVRWVILDDGVIGNDVGMTLQREGHQVVFVRAGESFGSGDTYYTVRPTHLEDYAALLSHLHSHDALPERVLHCWALTAGQSTENSTQTLGFQSVVAWLQAWGDYADTHPLVWWSVTTALFGVESTDQPDPHRMTLIAPLQVGPQELQTLTTRIIDLPTTALPLSRTRQILLGECAEVSPDRMVAWRGAHRWVGDYEPYPLSGETGTDLFPLRQGGTYVITGGWGGVGGLIAEYLAHTYQATLVLMGRTPLPPRESWDYYLRVADASDPMLAKLQRIMELEAAGATVVPFTVNVAEKRALRAAFATILRTQGPVNGVIHAAGFAGEKSVKLLGDIASADYTHHFEAKVEGTLALYEALRDQTPDFVLLISSNVTILGGLGATTYAAANLFMDAFAPYATATTGIRWISSTWDGWLTNATRTIAQGFQTSIDQYAMHPEESVEAFRRIVTGAAVSHVIVSTGDLPHRLALWTQPQQADPDNTTLHPRPTLTTAYTPPENELQGVIARVWQECLGIAELGIHDNFFDLGGNSLTGLKVIGKLKKELQREIPIVALFEGPTVHALSETLSRAADDHTAFDDSRDRGSRRREQRSRRTERRTEMGE